MKITFVQPFASHSGGTRVVATYARHLEQRGHEVCVVSQPERPLSTRKQIRRLLRGRGWQRPARKGTTLLDFLGPQHIILDRLRPATAADIPDSDVVIATWWETAEWVAALPPEKGRRFYLLQDYEVFPYLPRDRVVATYSLPLTKLAVSQYIIDTISENHGIGDITLLPNAVDLEQFSAPPRDRNADLRIGFLYSASPRKNIALATTAVREAKELLPHLQISVFSKTPPEDPHVLPADTHLHLDPAQADIPGLYATCDLWLLSSLNEGFGLPLLEAMACRTPVLSTPAGAAPDLIDGTNGVLAAPETEAFVAQIRRFDAMTPAEWRGYSDAAFATACRYGWEEATDRLLACLQTP